MVVSFEPSREVGWERWHILNLDTASHNLLIQREQGDYNRPYALYLQTWTVRDTHLEMRQGGRGSCLP